MEPGRAPKSIEYEPKQMFSRKPPEHQFMKQFRQFHHQAGNYLSVILVCQKNFQTCIIAQSQTQKAQAAI